MNRDNFPSQIKSGMPFNRYGFYNPFENLGGAFHERTWPTKTMTKAPKWCWVDLRDGNQALIDPMD